MLIEGSTMGNPAIPSYLEIIDFIAAGTTPQAIVDYRPWLEAQLRVAELIAREKEGRLLPQSNQSWIISSIWSTSFGWPRARATDPDQWLVISMSRRAFSHQQPFDDANTASCMRTTPAFLTKSITSLAASTAALLVSAIWPTHASSAIVTKARISPRSTVPAVPSGCRS